jgi:hypothetical protein
MILLHLKFSKSRNGSITSALYYTINNIVINIGRWMNQEVITRGIIRGEQKNKTEDLSSSAGIQPRISLVFFNTFEK